MESVANKMATKIKNRFMILGGAAETFPFIRRKN
jgi:hypothetical protein